MFVMVCLTNVNFLPSFKGFKADQICVHFCQEIFVKSSADSDFMMVLSLWVFLVVSAVTSPCLRTKEAPAVP